MLFLLFPFGFKIFSLSFCQFDHYGMFLLGLVLYGTLNFLDFGDCFLFQVREVFSCYIFKYYVRPFLSLLLWNPHNVNVSVFDVIQEVSQTILISFFFLSFFFFFRPHPWHVEVPSPGIELNTTAITRATAVAMPVLISFHSFFFILSHSSHFHHFIFCY